MDTDKATSTKCMVCGKGVVIHWYWYGVIGEWQQTTVVPETAKKMGSGYGWVCCESCDEILWARG